MDRCEVCGQPATVATLHKCVWLPPIVGLDGRQWPSVRGEGGYHLRCAAHRHETINETAAE